MENQKDEILIQHDKTADLSKIMIAFRWVTIISAVFLCAFTIIHCLRIDKMPDLIAALKASITWNIVSVFLMLLLFISVTVFSVFFSKVMRETGVKTRESNIERREIISSITRGYSAIYCLDCEKNDVKYIQQSGRLTECFGEKIDPEKPFDYYIETYCNKYVVDEDKERFLEKANIATIIEKLKERKFYSFTYKAMLDGNPAYFEMQSAKVEGSDSKIILGFLNVDDAVRDEKEKNTIVRESLDQVSLANSAKDKVLAHISHELLTPLNEVLGISTMMSLEPQTEKEVCENAEKITVATQNVVNLISDIMYSGAISNGEMMLHENRASLSEALDSACKKAGETALYKKIRINRFYSITHDLVFFDAEKVKAIFERLFNLAVKFSEPDSVIDFEAKESNEINGKIMYEFRIVAYGQGIKDDYVNSVLSDDSVLEKDTSPSGMSLEIAKRLTELIGGTIKIKSEIGRGTEAVIKLFFRLK